MNPVTMWRTFSFAGDPGATATRVAQLCDDMYSDTSDGLCGNEDCGQMSAWFVWSALECTLWFLVQDSLSWGSPMFKRAVVSPEGGSNRTEIRARGRHAQADYITECAGTTLLAILRPY